jgi:hypothetical protein
MTDTSIWNNFIFKRNIPRPVDDDDDEYLFCRDISFVLYISITLPKF